MDRWLVGERPAGPGDRVVALTAAELVGMDPVPFATAMSEPVERAANVVVRLPAYRGKRLVPLLGWLVVERLAAPEATVTWALDKQQGPDSVRAMLTELGWTLERRKAGRSVLLTGTSPTSTAIAPEPRRFTDSLGDNTFSFAADYGVFSPGAVDAGTRLLFDVAVRCEPVEAVADIGTGYGPLAIGLVRAGIAARAVGTDVDGVALWLAAGNAAAAGVELSLALSPEPTSVGPTSLTVCNVPTHVPAADSARLLSGLLKRGGRLLVVVHASLADRYARHLEADRRRVRRHPGAAHVVLEAS